MLPKVIVILGPTASGKTGWSLQLAKKYHGEIISADSRQVYQKMNIGTAKTLPSRPQRGGSSEAYVVEGVRHYLIDFLDPGKTFAVAEFRDAALEAITDITSRGKLPFVVGGTGLYISSLIDNWQIPKIPANKSLRQSLESKTAEELGTLLDVLDPSAAKKIDHRNRRRLVRALEVCILSGESWSSQQKKGEPLVLALRIGIEVPREALYARIDERIDEMMDRGLLDEIRSLRKQKYDWSLPSMSGIGYKQFRPFFEKKKSLEECVSDLKRDTRHFARRQLTWFRRDKEIHWCRTIEEADALMSTFLAS